MRVYASKENVNQAYRPSGRESSSSHWPDTSGDILTQVASAGYCDTAHVSVHWSGWRLEPPQNLWEGIVNQKLYAIKGDTHISVEVQLLAGVKGSMIDAPLAGYVRTL